MKTFLLTATYLVGIGELALAVFFWVTHSKSEIRKVMALLAFSTGMWVVLSAALAYKPSSSEVLIISDFVFVFGVLILTTLVYLVAIFPYPLYRFDKIHKMLLYAPALLFFGIALFTDSISVGVTGNNFQAGEVIPGPAYSVYNIFLLFLYMTSIVLLQYRRNKLDGLMRENVSLVLFSVLAGGLPAIYVDLLAPLFGLPTLNFLIGNVFTAIWLGATSLIILRR